MEKGWFDSNQKPLSITVGSDQTEVSLVITEANLPNPVEPTLSLVEPSPVSHQNLSNELAMVREVYRLGRQKKAFDPFSRETIQQLARELGLELKTKLGKPVTGKGVLIKAIWDKVCHYSHLLISYLMVSLYQIQRQMERDPSAQPVSALQSTSVQLVAAPSPKQLSMLDRQDFSTEQKDEEQIIYESAPKHQINKLTLPHLYQLSLFIAKLKLAGSARSKLSSVDPLPDLYADEDWATAPEEGHPTIGDEECYYDEESAESDDDEEEDNGEEEQSEVDPVEAVLPIPNPSRKPLSKEETMQAMKTLQDFVHTHVSPPLATFKQPPEYQFYKAVRIWNHQQNRTLASQKQERKA